MWQGHLLNLLKKAASQAIPMGGSTLVGIVVIGILGLVAGYGFTVLFEWWEGGRTMASFLAALKSWTPWAGGICGVVFCWLVLFLWQIPVLIYKDHNFLVSQANAPKPVCPVCTSCPICPKSVARPKSVAHDGEKFGEDRRQYVCGLQEYQRRLFSQALGEAPAGSLALIAVGDARDTPAKDCHDLLLSLFPSTKWTVGQVGGGTTTISSDTGFADSPFTCFAKDINSVAAKSLKNAFKSVDIVCDWSRRFSPLMRDGDVGILVNPMPH